MILACLLANLALLPQDPPREPTMLERIDALIAKSNAYEGFVARYRIDAGHGREVSMRLAYRGPHELAIDTQGGGWRSFIRFVADGMDDLRIQDGAPTTKASLRDWAPTACPVEILRGLLDKEFPKTLRADDLTPSDRPMIKLELRGDSISFSFGFGSAKHARLEWLDVLRRSPERLSRGGEGARELALKLSEDHTLFVSPDTGFVTRLEKRTDSGVRVDMQLVSLQTDSRPEDSELELPEVGEDVRDGSKELVDVMRVQAFNNSRDELFGLVARVLDDGRLKWTEESPAKMERVLRGMHAVAFAPFVVRLVASEEPRIDGYIDSLHEFLGRYQLDDPQDLGKARTCIGVVRSELQKSLDKDMEDVLSLPAPPGSCATRPSLYEDLSAIEKRVLSDLFAESVTKPVLLEFDEQAEKLLESK